MIIWDTLICVSNLPLLATQQQQSCLHNIMGSLLYYDALAMGSQLTWQMHHPHKLCIYSME